MTTAPAPAPEVKGLMIKSCIIAGTLNGKVAVVTGANSGIGAATATELARRGCLVIMACRSQERAQKAEDEILKKYGNVNPYCTIADLADKSLVGSMQPINEDQLIIELVDLGSQKSIRDFAARISGKYQKIDYLINNAGLAPDKYGKTEDGFEQIMGINHLGTFLLTELLLPAVKRAAPSRIINLTSMLYSLGKLRKPDLFCPEKDYNSDFVYSDSKLCNLLHARELSRRLKGSGVMAVSLHPGTVNSNFYRDFGSITRKMSLAFLKPFLMTNREGAQTTMYTVLTEKLVSGGYYSNCALKEPSAKAKNDADSLWLWEKSEELLGLPKN